MNKMLIKKLSIFLILAAPLAVSAQSALHPSSAHSTEITNPDNALEHYLHNTDSSFHWEIRNQYKVNGATVFDLTMISQTWRNIKWAHELLLVVPEENQYDGALLMIVGGHNKNGTPEWAKKDDEFLEVATGIATQNKALVAVLRQTPNEPLYDGLTEDELISYTLHNFKKDGDYTWPLLFPMVKSAVRAMDAIQEFAAGQLHHPINRFVVSGASKRGWTTWLTGANDKRVEAIGPMVIDILNMPVNLDYQIKAWHEYSIQIEDYVKLGIPQQASSASGMAINRMVDPYSYRRLLTMPKMIFMGTNDEYWVVDAIKNYYDSIPGRNMIMYSPNVGHNLGGGKEAFNTLSAFLGLTLRHQAYPDCSWSVSSKKGKVTITINCSPANLVGAVVWSANSENMIFTKSVWTSREISGSAGKAKIKFTEKMPPGGFRAFYMDCRYKSPNGGVFTQSTRMFVMDKDELKLH